MACPKCGFASAPGALECPRCGIVFARFSLRREAPAAAGSAGAAAPEGLGDPAGAFASSVAGGGGESEAIPASGVSREGWIVFAAGLPVAGLALLSPLATLLLNPLLTLVHEMGHAATGWLFGYPSIPAFDFGYGGGMTLQQDRVGPILFAIAAAGVAGLRLFRHNPVTRTVIAVALAAWGVAAWLPVHRMLILAMGHGGELVFATLFLHRALSGRGVRVPAERPLYAVLGWFVVLHDLRFANGLWRSPAARALYGEAKGGGHWMDFSRIAEDFLRCPLERVAFLFLLCTLLTPAVAVLLQRPSLRAVLARLRRVELPQ